MKEKTKPLLSLYLQEEMLDLTLKAQCVTFRRLYWPEMEYKIHIHVFFKVTGNE